MSKDFVGLTEEEKNKYASEYKSIVGWATSNMIEEFSSKSGRIPYTFEEIYDEALVGFVKALDAYNKNKNAKFITFAYRCMRNQAISYINRNNKKRFYMVKEYYKSIGAYDKIEEYDKEKYYDEKLVKEYEVSEEEIDLVQYNSIKIIINSDIEGVIEFLESNLNKTGLYVLKHYINPKGDMIPNKKQSEIAEDLGITQGAISKSLQKIRDITLDYITRKEPNVAVC